MSPLPAPSGALHESPAATAYRLGLGLASWIYIYFAWGWIALVLAVAAPLLLSVPGDRPLTVFPVPGPVRVGLEAGLVLIGVLAATVVAGRAVGALLLAGLVILVAWDRRRWAWLWRR